MELNFYAVVDLEWRALHSPVFSCELGVFLHIHIWWIFVAPKSPELHLEPLNCTTISVKWQQDAEDTATIQGYKLYYKEEGQQEHGPIFLDTSGLLYTLSGLGEWTCIVLFLFSFLSDHLGEKVIGYKAESLT